MENITFSTTNGKMNWLKTVAAKTNKSVDYLINLLIDGYLEDVEDSSSSPSNSMESR